ncbi:AAA family ATPase [Paracoccus sp. DMF-8]|uniref:AAA family ATPase n=1 Tax=Paracoccus sp. DMF-8 TaxID=3019445 RepID=UPI0023E7DCB5|nr:AAA family ATPase [Paracoccus sp. DMF-8]MDF3606533.1 AAA family ATPase [Paracoccus sp. DMF-8]
MSDQNKFSQHAAAVARELLGEENKQLSTPNRELRFGKQGSVSVDLQRGAFFDHSENQGGGVLWFIEKQTGQTVAGGKAVQWLRDHGYYVEDDGFHRPQQRAANGGSAPQGVGSRVDPNGNWLPQRVPDNGRLTATHDYLDARGKLAYQVVRFDWDVDPSINPKGHDKTFTQRVPDSSKRDGFSYKVKDRITPVPYRLPELIEDLADGRPIFIVEGEKKVDLLRAQGVPATCNHGGAGKFPEELIAHFKGADVIILPDNDDPGRDHANLIGRKLDGVASRIRVLDLPGLPPKGGVDDWFPAGGDVEQLYDLVDSDARTFEAAPFESRFGAVEWQNFDAPGPKYEYLIKGVLTRSELSFLAGASQSGKSFIAIDMAMAVARGVEWFGHKVRRGGVIYQAGESAAGVRRRRFPAYRQKYDCGADPLSVVLLERPVDFYNSDDDVDAFIEECLHWKKKFRDPLELIIIDTFNKATPGANENDGKDMGSVLARCERVRRATGAHVMLVHHMNADGTKMRGHTSLFGNVDNVVTVRKIPDKTDADNRQVREWVLSKQKDGEDGIGAKFVLPSLIIGQDSDGDPITSCTVAPPNTGADDDGIQERGAITIGGGHGAVLRLIYDAVKEHGELAPSSLGLSRGAMAVTRDVLWERALSVMVDHGDPIDLKKGETEEDARARRIEDVRKRVKHSRSYLFEKGVIKAGDRWIWLTGKPVKGFPEAPGLGDAAMTRRRRSGPGTGPRASPPPDVQQDAMIDQATGLPFDPEDFIG